MERLDTNSYFCFLVSSIVIYLVHLLDNNYSLNRDSENVAVIIVSVTACHGNLYGLHYVNSYKENWSVSGVL